MNSTLATNSNTFINSSQPSNGSGAVYTRDHYLIYLMNTWILAPMIVFGCGGNVLNLVVLLHKTMRSRTNMIFAAMAVSDLAFLLLHVPRWLFFAGPLYKWEFLRTHNLSITSLINWSSATSIWLMTYATLERVQVIRSPFGANTRTAVSFRFILTIVSICVAAFILTGAHFLRDFSIMSDRAIVKSVLMHVNAYMVVIGPLCLCTLLNWRLVQALKMNNRCWNSLESDDNAHNQALIQNRAKTERKVTLVVCVIISSFLVFNVPGALLFIFREISSQDINADINFVLLQTICNTLATTGKVLNFVLFCLTSDHFRKLLRERCTRCAQFPRRSSSRSQRTTTIQLETL